MGATWAMPSSLDSESDGGLVNAQLSLRLQPELELLNVTRTRAQAAELRHCRLRKLRGRWRFSASSLYMIPPAAGPSQLGQLEAQLTPAPDSESESSGRGTCAASDAALTGSSVTAEWHAIMCQWHIQLWVLRSTLNLKATDTSLAEGEGISSDHTFRLRH